MRVLLAAACFSAILSAQTADLLRELIRVDTSNPPGNESKLDELLAAKLRPLGFTVEMFPTPAAGKTHMIARLQRRRQRAAGADRFACRRGRCRTRQMDRGSLCRAYQRRLYVGRGAIDFKGGIAVFAEAVMRLARNHIPLKRDVIFMVEADEEAQPYNTSWLARNALGQIWIANSRSTKAAGSCKRDNGTVRYVSISTADKTSPSRWC